MNNSGKPAFAIAIGALVWVLLLPRPDGATPFTPEPNVQPEPPLKAPILPWRKPKPRTTTPAKDDVFVIATNSVCPYDSNIELTCDLPPALRHKNTVGRDGSGLCVFWSATHAARYQNERRLFDFAVQMQKEIGGGDPEKLDRMIAKYGAGTDYVQHVGGDEEFLDLAIRTGRMPAITYCGVDGLPQRYGQNVIAHMVNLVYLDKDYAAILDNNWPNEIVWMTRKTLLSRWKGDKLDGKPYMGRDQRGRTFPIGGGWAAALLEAAPPPPPQN